jgi:hypothetical protein
MSIRIKTMNTKQVKNYYESDAEEDHSSDSDYTEENSSSESENEYEYEEDNEPINRASYYNPRSQLGPKPDAHTIKVTEIKNNVTKEMREKKEKQKTRTKKMTKVRGYKRVRILDGPDWTSSLDTDRMRTRSESKRYKEECKINEDMLKKLEADGHLLINNNTQFVLRK